MPSDDYQVSSLVLGHIHILCCLRSCLETLCKYISRVCTRPMVYQDSCESSNTPKPSINNHDFFTSYVRCDTPSPSCEGWWVVIDIDMVDDSCSFPTTWFPIISVSLIKLIHRVTDPLVVTWTNFNSALSSGSKISEATHGKSRFTGRLIESDLIWTAGSQVYKHRCLVNLHCLYQGREIWQLIFLEEQIFEIPDPYTQMGGVLLEQYYKVSSWH